MKEARIMKENITYYLVWIICLLAGCTPTPKQIEDTTDPIPMYPDYTDIMIPTNIAPLNFLLRNDADDSNGLEILANAGLENGENYFITQRFLHYTEGGFAL